MSARFSTGVLSQSAVGLTQAPQLLSHWVPPLSHAFLPAAVINIDLNPDGQVRLQLAAAGTRLQPPTSPTAMRSFAFASLGQLSARFWRGCPHICRRASFGMILDGGGGYICCPLAWELVLLWRRKYMSTSVVCQV